MTTTFGPTTSATISDNYRWLVGKAKPTELHLGLRGTSWKPPSECWGGMGGQPDGGYRAVCGAWCLLGDELVDQVPVCKQCEVAARNAGTRVT